MRDEEAPPRLYGTTLLLFAEWRFDIQTLTLQDLPQMTKPLHLNPTYTFAGQSDFITYIFSWCGFITQQGKTPDQHFMLLSIQLEQPLNDVLLHVIVLRSPLPGLCLSDRIPEHPLRAAPSRYPPRRSIRLMSSTGYTAARRFFCATRKANLFISVRTGLSNLSQIELHGAQETLTCPPRQLLFFS
ncbi:MAG: hypothetical protein GPOALKHO_001303 [Sodalis sp.]|nr:MAG: hypothetical protein GPOALKHO_001303 [Sodalis sp.]